MVAQVNPRMPFTRGDALVDADLVDLALEVDTPLPSPGPRHTDDLCSAIGHHVAAYACDGGTVQLGIGQTSTGPERSTPTAR